MYVYRVLHDKTKLKYIFTFSFAFVLIITEKNEFKHNHFFNIYLNK